MQFLHNLFDVQWAPFSPQWQPSSLKDMDEGSVEALRFSNNVTHFNRLIPLFSAWFAFSLPGSGLATYVPILLLRLGRFSQISPGSVLTQPLCRESSWESERNKERAWDRENNSCMFYCLNKIWRTSFHTRQLVWKTCILKCKMATVTIQIKIRWSSIISFLCFIVCGLLMNTNIYVKSPALRSHISIAYT